MLIRNFCGKVSKILGRVLACGYDNECKTKEACKALCAIYDRRSMEEISWRALHIFQ